MEEPTLTCDGCGVCCLHVGHPWFNRHSEDPHWQRLPEHLKTEVNEYIAGMQDADIGEPCIWYDHDLRQCRHYEFRPQMCRDFETGNPHCLRMREQYGIEQPQDDQSSERET